MAAPSTATVWTASVGPGGAIATLDNILDDDEKQRAARFRQEGDRDRFVAGRTLLRHVLSETAKGQVAPGDWRFREGENGKPEMAPGLPPFEFNVSHAGEGVAVCAGEPGPVGVDIEPAVRDDRLEIVTDVLSDNERALLGELREDEQWPAFLRYWTVKEACAKALGLGVAFEFHTLEVSPDLPSVAAPPGLLEPRQTLAVETRELVMADIAYRLGVAQITNSGEETEFRFTTLNGTAPHPPG